MSALLLSISARAECSPPLYYNIVHAVLKLLSVGVANEALAQSALACDHERAQAGRDCTKHVTIVLASYSASYCAAIKIANRFIVHRHVWSIEIFVVRPPSFHWLLAKILDIHSSM